MNDLTSKEMEALEHIDRNGSLLWMPYDIYTIQKLYKSLQSKGLIERNKWSNEWVKIATQI